MSIKPSNLFNDYNNSWLSWNLDPTVMDFKGHFLTFTLLFFPRVKLCLEALCPTSFMNSTLFWNLLWLCLFSVLLKVKSFSCGHINREGKRPTLSSFFFFFFFILQVVQWMFPQVGLARLQPQMYVFYPPATYRTYQCECPGVAHTLQGDSRIHLFSLTHF